MPRITETHPEDDPAWRRSFRRRIRGWYEHNGRDLPWRRTRDPYRIWISEVMLQQTTVAAVTPYYDRFLAALPTVAALAAAPQSRVLRLWEGLGYYSRARNLHAAAKEIVGTRRGKFPRTVSEWQTLPGIGRYTAGAIVSFAFDEAAPIVEANTRRLYSRLVGLECNPQSTQGQRRLWSFAESILPRAHPAVFNHALMDLGATVCRADGPRCDQCPVRQNCVAYSSGRQNELPRKGDRVAMTDVTEAYLVVVHENRLLLRQRTTSERWAGLWDFPRYQLSDESLKQDFPVSPSLPLPFTASETEKIIPILESQLVEQTDISAEILEPFAEIRHGVTRYRIRVVCFDARFQSGSPRSGVRWIEFSDMGKYPLSSSGRKLTNLLTERGRFGS